MNQSCCEHSRVCCLNQYELIRKYRCADCDGVMMCACDEVFGHRFLAHQLEYGVELETQVRVRVTLHFQANICSACGGMPLVAAPVAATAGRTSKIKRYYWRELYFAETERMADWKAANPDASPVEIHSAERRIAKEVLVEMKALHLTAPKYNTHEPSQSDILERFTVEVDAFHPEYAAAPERGAVVIWEGEIVSPETFTTRQYEALGWSVMPLESAPLHALFGVMMWLLIEDPGDQNTHIVQFGSRTAFEAGEEAPVITTCLPEDFGTSGYGSRRVKEIDEHFAFLSPDGTPDRDGLLELFDYWRDPSEKLRQYVWAHHVPDVNRARRLIEVLPAETTVAILRYLVDNYWRRYLGWPDLLMWQDVTFMMVEVKSSSDKLSAEQMRWIADNHDLLKVPFRIVKLHRTRSTRLAT